MSVENNAVFWFFLTTLSDWSRQLAPLSQPIRRTNKTNRDLHERDFLRDANYIDLLRVLIDSLPGGGDTPLNRLDRYV